jgi:hypothetical protein
MKFEKYLFSFLVTFGRAEILSEITFSPSASSPSNKTSSVPSYASNSPSKQTNVTTFPSPSLSPFQASNTSEPTLVPTGNATLVPTGNATEAPTLAPTNTTVPPTSTPTLAPTNATDRPTTGLPTGHPTLHPSYSPSSIPTSKPANHKSSIGTILAKTLGWLILIALSVILFGAVMSNRYQIYYALRGVWFTILQMNCTRWIIVKLGSIRLGGGGGRPTGALDEIIFDRNDMTEGLLMGDT